MAEPVVDRLPSVVHKRDGHAVPFEADKISQSLYAATESLGKPSAFLARELADGVLHFLAAETGAEEPTTTQIAELVAKVVRELGQPRLAQVYADRHERKRETTLAPLREKSARSAALHFVATDLPDHVVHLALEAYSLQAVFGRDVAAAHEEGLLSLGGLDHPVEFARKVVEQERGQDGWALIDEPAPTLIFDSPEYGLTESSARPWLRQLAQFCRANRREANLNLHVQPPPAWAQSAAQGPLFEAGTGAPSDRTAAVLAVLLDEFLALKCASLRLDWHLSQLDFDQEQAGRLQELLHRAAGGSGMAFTFDRPRRQVALGTGVDRQHAAALLDVRLHLPRCLLLPEIAGDAQLFIDKLPVLARMAVRAGIQKRNYLRGLANARPGLARGFLLERARLVIIPAGLDEVVQSLLGQSMVASKLSLDLGRNILQVLNETTEAESRSTNLEIALDGPGNEFPGFASPLDMKRIQAAGALHGLAGFGAVALEEIAAAETVSLLHHAWKKTDIVRVEF